MKLGSFSGGRSQRLERIPKPLVSILCKILNDLLMGIYSYSRHTETPILTINNAGIRIVKKIGLR